MNLAFHCTVAITLAVVLSSSAMAASRAPAPVCGNGAIEAPEQCDDANVEYNSGEYCDAACELVPCSNPKNSADHVPEASDALFALKAGVGTATCDTRVCDVNNNQEVTATDALLVLKKAVGQTVTLNCGTAVFGACRLDDAGCVLQ